MLRSVLMSEISWDRNKDNLNKNSGQVKKHRGSPVCGKDGQSVVYLRTRYLVNGRFEIGDISISL